jgi:type I restriction enzyme S subunit
LDEIADEGGGEIRTGPFGSQLHRHDYTDVAGAVPVVMPLNMVGGRIDAAGIAKITPAKALKMSVHVTHTGDVLLSRRGDIGRYCLVDAANAGALCGTGSLRISIQKSSLTPEYLCFYLETPRGLHELQSRAVGSTMPNINAAIVRSLEIPLPPLPVQRKVVAILSAYDDLIENTQRQVKIVAEMAQRIYREWFVDFRYPGHEAVPLVESELGPRPTGWEVESLFDLAEVTFGFPFKSASFNTTHGVPVIRIRDIPAGESATLTTETAPPVYAVENGDILVGMDGDFHMARWSSGRAWLNQRVARFRPKPHGRLSRYALYLALEGPIRRWNATIVGTTVAHLGKSHLTRIKLLVPPEHVTMRATEVLEPIFEAEIRLRQRTRVLRATRDLILPHLVSGAIDVNDLVIAAPELTA